MTLYEFIMMGNEKDLVTLIDINADNTISPRTTAKCFVDEKYHKTLDHKIVGWYYGCDGIIRLTYNSGD